MDARDKMRRLLGELYPPEQAARAFDLLTERIDAHRTVSAPLRPPLTQRDVMLIAYGDVVSAPGEAPLRTLKRLLDRDLGGEITNVHLLPVCPYTSDDGFSVTDFLSVDPKLGDWPEIADLGASRGLMLDAVINHTSKSHPWFRKCLEGEPPYRDYYIEGDSDGDYSRVFRPRTSPLLTPFEAREGVKYFWTTFSDDQVDLNYHSPELLAEVAEVLLQYARRGARFIRLDAIGFAWKEPGTRCMSLPQTHALVRLLRLALNAAYPGVMLITETNVAHAENISYFGQGDEAQLVYQFPLPPLVMFSLLRQSARRLTQWAGSLEQTPLPAGTTYFNFLASHDGIGVGPVQGLLDAGEQQVLLDATLAHGGRISYKSMPDGGSVPYELNISYMDALTPPEADDSLRLARFMAAQAVMLSMRGMPGIYYHSLLGSRSWREGAERSGINRRINREKLRLDALERELSDPGSLRARVLSAYREMLRIRGTCSAFSPYAGQRVEVLDPRVFALERFDPETGCRAWVRINLSGDEVALDDHAAGTDLLSSDGPTDRLAPYQTRWIVERSR